MTEQHSQELSNGHPLPPSEVARPAVFRAFIGGFMGPSFSVELDGDELVYRHSPGAYANWQELRLDAASLDWDALRATLDELNVWRWRDDYRSSVIDGTHWSLHLAWGESSCSAGGANCYPDSHAEPFPGSEPSPTFECYLSAVQRLLGGRRFR